MPSPHAPPGGVFAAARESSEGGLGDSRVKSVHAVPRTPWTTGQKTLALFVVLLALFVSFFNLGSARTLTSHEGYLAVSTHEMLLSQDWIVPRFAGLPRLTKPPLGYWSAAVCTLCCGGKLTEFTARLPSALSGIALVALVGWWGAKWYGRSAGLCAALIQATSLHYLLFAREATVDMLQCLLMTIAMALIGWQPLEESHWKARFRWLGIFTLLGVLALAKFHFGPVLVLAPVVVFWGVQRQWRAFLNLCNPLGILVFTVLALAWPVLILQQLPEAFAVWQHETLGRALGEMQPEPWWYFLPALAYLMLPWGVLLPWLIPDVWKRAVREQDSHDRYLCIWVIVQTVLLSLSSNKHRNYLIPALPAVAILLGPLLLRVRDWRTSARLWVPSLLTVLITGGAITAHIAVSRKWPTASAGLFSVCLVAVCGLLTTMWLLHFHKLRSAGIAGALTYVAGLAIILQCVTPARDFRHPAAEFVQQVRKELPVEKIRTFQMGQATVLFYLGLPVQRLESPQELHAELEQKTEFHLLAIRTHLEGLQMMGNVDVIDSLPPGHPNTTHQTDDLVLMRIRRSQ